MSRLSRFLPCLFIFSACTAGTPSTHIPVNTANNTGAIVSTIEQVQEEPEKPSSLDPQTNDQVPKTRPESCPADRLLDGFLPNVAQSDFDRDSWSKNKKVIMSVQAIEKHNKRIYDPMNDLDTLPERSLIENNLRTRLQSFKKKFDNDEIMFEDGTKPEAQDWEKPLADFDKSYDEYASGPKQYILLDDTMILCGPHDKHYIKTKNGEVRFSRNNCSLGRAQSRIEVIFESDDGMRFVRTQDMWGWIGPNAKLSPELIDKSAKNQAESRWFAKSAMTLAGMNIPKGAFLAGTKNDVFVATDHGFERISPKTNPDLIDTHRPLTRKDWIDTLFLFLNDPYGWGGHDGWRDCSRLIMDTARSFNLRLPRNSKEQAVQTSYFLKVAGMAPKDKLQQIIDAAKTGIVLLHFPGHIMAWLGQNKDGNPFVLHAFSEFYESCNACQSETPSDCETLVHVDKVVISDLSLGQNTTRMTFLDRITHISVLTDLTRTPDDTPTLPWQSTRNWTPQEETLYAAFIERLFDYPDELDKSWTNLGDVLRDKDHNILFNALGQNEDNGLRLQPDCADLPYLLRSYFAWKRGLPMAVRKCSRGNEKTAPACGAPAFENEFPVSGTATKRFNAFANNVGGYRVHSGNARTALDDDKTDLYPVELTRQSLRPGTVFADPHGHLLMIAHYTPDTKEVPGALLSVDAQPDGTITRKRFWKGNFLFDPNIKNVGAGFKAFRPVVNGRQLTNDELTKKSGFTPYSTEQQHAAKESFYDRVEAAIHPTPLAIPDAIKELTDSLHESAQRRVVSVQTGDDFARANPSINFVMPNGYAVFETSGPWEDYATPSRDMRLLIAIDAVRDFPDKIRRNARLYGLNTDAEVEEAVQNAQKIIDENLESAHISYLNSQNQPVTLSIGDVARRVDALEMGYHPADCNEVRWGAPEGSDELKTCSRRAPATEQAKLEKMRKWFRLRSRPPR